MRVMPTELPDVLLLLPNVFEDDRGFFFESYNRRVVADLIGFTGDFVQDNHSRSTRGVLRGMHYQVQRTQGKLIRVVRGTVFDVAVDMRRSSPTFGRWVGVTLSEHDHAQLWIPPGFAHGFQVTSESADVLYKTTDYHAPEAERSVAWNDPTLAITWPLPDPILSGKDRLAPPLAQAESFA